MQTCSNCGSVSRDGAKFCTTCGSRLNEVIDSNAASGWESYPAQDETSESLAVEPDVEAPVADTAAPEVKSTPAEAEESASTTSWSWGQSSADEPADPEGNKPVDPEEDTEVATSSSDSESLSSWATQWTSSTVGADEPNPVVEPEYDVTSEVDESETTVEAVADAEVEVETDEPAQLAGDVAPVVSYVGPSTVASDTPTPKSRAQSLLFELRELIDESFGGFESTPPATISGETGDALATLSAVGSDGGKFDNLRTMLEKAREQPRDVDTMLNLLGEINSLIALVDSHERLITAVDTAKRQLS